MRIIKLPEWNDLPEAVRTALADEGRLWQHAPGEDAAAAIYAELRHQLDGLNLDNPDDQDLLENP